MATAEKIIEKLKATNSSRQLLYEMSCQQFYKLEWPIAPKRSSEQFFIFKIEQPTSIDITVDPEPIDLFYGQISTIRECDKNIGFMVSLPIMQNQIQYDYLISSPKSTKVNSLNDSAEVFLTTDKFSVFTLDKTIQFVAAFNRSIINQFT